MSPGLWLLVGVAALALFVVLEGRRQARKLEREEGYRRRGTGPNLLGIGMLELQGHLQADRNIDAIRIELQEDDRQHPEYRPGDVGEGRDPGSPPDREDRRDA